MSKPLLPAQIASKLQTAAAELHVRPGLPDVAQYIAKMALDTLPRRSTSHHGEVSLEQETEVISHYKLVKGIMQCMQIFLRDASVRTPQTEIC